MAIQNPQSPEQIQTILSELRSGEKAKSSALKSVIFLAVTLVLFFSLGLLQNPVLDIVLIIVVLAVHEIGHLLMMKAFGYKDVKMFFIPLFGAAVTGEAFEPSGTRKALVSLAGPVPGLLLGLIMVAIGMTRQSQILLRIAFLFIFINGLNLLPLYPFDGGRFFHDILFSRNRTLDAGVTGLAGIILVLIGYQQGFWLLTILGVFVLLSIKKNYSLAGAAEEAKRKLAGTKAVPVDQAPEEAIAVIVKELDLEIPQLAAQPDAIKDVWERIHTRMPSVPMTILFLLGYGLMIAVIGGFFLGFLK